MYRLTNLSSQWYALEINSIEDDIENIKEFTSTGTPIILCEDFDNLYELGINKNEIEIVSDEE